jgi:hypothetical protein
MQTYGEREPGESLVHALLLGNKHQPSNLNPTTNIHPQPWDRTSSFTMEMGVSLDLALDLALGPWANPNLKKPSSLMAQWVL